MTTFSQSATNDFETYTIGNKSYIKMASGVDAYGVILADAVRTLRGELQLDVGRGVPYIETVFSSGYGLAQWKNAVRNTVMSYPFVTNIDSFDAEIVNGMVSYKLVVSTDDGEAIVEN